MGIEFTFVVGTSAIGSAAALALLPSPALPETVSETTIKDENVGYKSYEAATAMLIIII